MSNELEEKINRFASYFGKQLKEIETLKSSDGTPAEVYQCLLLASSIDAIAGAVLPKRKGNRDRFIYFVQRFCRWSDGDRVSLPHLVQLLKKNPDPAFEKLRLWAIERYAALPVHGSALMPISHDPSYDEVNRFWPSEKEHRTPLDGIDLSSLQHFHLLYAYRNSLVHEFRRPGYGMEFGSDNGPFYHQMSTVRESELVQLSVELVYPRKFLIQLCETGLKDVTEYFRKNQLDPFSSFRFGTYWIRELND